jgi:hypothetical protein
MDRFHHTEGRSVYVAVSQNSLTLWFRDPRCFWGGSGSIGARAEGRPPCIARMVSYVLASGGAITSPRRSPGR